MRSAGATVVGQQLVTLGVEQHRDAVREPRARGSCTVVSHQALVRVVPELVLEALVVCPVPKCRGVGKADADDLDTERLKPFIIVAEPATLGRSTGRVGDREEPHDGGPVLEVAPHPRGAVVVGRHELWCGQAGLDHRAVQARRQDDLIIDHVPRVVARVIAWTGIRVVVRGRPRIIRVCAAVVTTGQVGQARSTITALLLGLTARAGKHRQQEHEAQSFEHISPNFRRVTQRVVSGGKKLMECGCSAGFARFSGSRFPRRSRPVLYRAQSSRLRRGRTQ